MITARHRRFLEKLPTLREIRFVKKTHADRRPCPVCDRLDRAVTSRGWVTYYGPATCPGCGHARGLRPVLRRIDLGWLRDRCGLRSEAAYRSAWRERLEVFGPGFVGGFAGGPVLTIDAGAARCPHGETIKQTETNPGPDSDAGSETLEQETPGPETEANADAGSAIDAA
jgi:hypothetical protein